MDSKPEPMVIVRLATARRLGVKDNAGWVVEEPLYWLLSQIKHCTELLNAEPDPLQRMGYAGMIMAYADLYKRMQGIAGIE